VVVMNHDSSNINRLKFLNTYLDDKEQDLQDLLFRLRILEAGVHEGFWDLHIGSGKTGNIEDDFEYYSPRFKKFLGYTEEEFPNVAKSWMTAIHPEDREIAAELAVRHMENAENVPYDLEVRYKHKDGHWLWVMCKGRCIFDERGNPVRFVGIHQDISVLKSRELKLQEDTFRLSTVIELCSGGYWDSDLVEDTVYISNNFKKLLGYESESVPYDNAWIRSIVYNKDMLQHADDILKKVIQEKGENFQVEISFKHKDGHEVKMVSKAKVFYQDDKPSRVVGINQLSGD